MSDFSNKLYKSQNVLWRTVSGPSGNEFIEDIPLCPNSTCHMLLQVSDSGYLCPKCEKEYVCRKDHDATVREVRDAWEGFQTLGYEVHSLDLPPTKVVDEDKEDKKYWVQARISEKEGKRMAVVYFGERINGKQEKTDYSQVFLDFEDEQLRFDKTNKSPMKLLSKLTAEFSESKIVISKNK